MILHGAISCPYSNPNPKLQSLYYEVRDRVEPVALNNCPTQLCPYHLLVKVIDSSWYDAVNLNFEARLPTLCKRFHTLMLETAPALQQTSSKLRTLPMSCRATFYRCITPAGISKDDIAKLAFLFVIRQLHHQSNHNYLQTKSRDICCESAQIQPKNQVRPNRRHTV